MGGMTLEGMERGRSKVRLANRILCWVLPAAALAAGADLHAWNAQMSLPLLALPPALEELSRPLAPVGTAGLSADRFEQPVKAVPAPAAGKPKQETQVAPESQWKLRGVLMGGNKRAMLEDQSGKSVWVSEGDLVGSARIKEIRERSVMIEGEEGEYEIRI